MITGIAHICFTVRDLEASVDFYQNKLGIAHAFDFTNDQGERTGVYLHAGDRTFIELFPGEPEERDDAQSYRHVCFEVDDLESTLAALSNKEVEATPMELGGDQSWQAWVEDPDGNRIELHGYTPESKQNVRLTP